MESLQSEEEKEEEEGGREVDEEGEVLIVPTDFSVW